MIHLQNILVPVDFSEPSKKAVNYGLSLALEFKARLIFAYVTPEYEEAQARMLELLPAEYRKTVELECIVRIGNVHEQIRQIVGEKQIDLVVMGSHGRRYFERIFLGSFTERMLRQLPVPILTVAHLDPDKEIQPAGPVPLKRILYATDLSDGSEGGLQFSMRLARAVDAHLTVVHALRSLDHVFLGGESAAYLPDYRAEVRAKTQERLDRTVANWSDGKVPITTMVRDGVPYQAINKTAEAINADVIVMNLHGKGRVERALLGSTAERVIRTATVPVLSLPMPVTYASRWAAA